MQYKLETLELKQTAIRRVAEALLYPSFCVPLVLLGPPNGDFEVSLRCVGALSEVYALGNKGGVTNEAGFNGSRTYVHVRMNLCKFSGTSNSSLGRHFVFKIIDKHNMKDN